MSSATELANFLACRRIGELERMEAAGLVKKPFFSDPTVDLLVRLGEEHERKHLQHLTSDGLDVVEIDNNDPYAHVATIDAMRSGAAGIYQAVFRDGAKTGRADFLIRVDRPSHLGFWSYEAVETKLARSTKARAIIQLCHYSEFLAGVQGVEPEWMHVVLGGGSAPEKFRVQHYLAYFRKVDRDLQAAQETRSDTYPEPVEHCSVCSWFSLCDAQRRNDDHLSLVAGITRNQRMALVEHGITTLASLGELQLPITPKIERIASAPLLRIREQARVQLEGRNNKVPVRELLESEDRATGLGALPAPSPGDVFLDFESDPWAFEQGLEYLFGYALETESPDAEPEYRALWAFDPAHEKRIFDEFIEWLMKRWEQYPDMHVYHYAHYEETAIKRLAGRHATCIDEVDKLLRAEVLVDLFRIVRQSVRASVESYSIKNLEQFYNFTRRVPLPDARFSLQAFSTVLALGESTADAGQLIQTIENYNRDDCLSARALRQWLESLRCELEIKTSWPLPRPERKSGDAAEDLETRLQESEALFERLTGDLPENESDWSSEQHAKWLLAHLLQWHRREDKSMWWEYFRLCDLSDQELLEDRHALGGLEYVGEVGLEKKSIIHRYSFPPQDHGLDRALDAHDPRTRKSAGKVVSINDADHTIDLKRGASSQTPHPAALIPCDAISPKEMENSIKRIASWVAEAGLNDRAQLSAACDLLMRRPPRLKGGMQIEAFSRELGALEASKRIALMLDGTVLAIQGPPGAGKTYTGARMILDLIAAGHKVGITAASHKVISNLLSEVCKAAEEQGVSFKAIQRIDDERDACGHHAVVRADSNPDVVEELSKGEAQLFGGTSWLWSRQEMARSVDVLFVDEAGQMSLANVLAVSQAADSLVLLGDPQQLDQPQKGVHPPGAGVSALAHLLNGQATIGNDRGIFLNETWRLPPYICKFTSELFYDGRLTSRPENSNQRLNTSGGLDGTGLRLIPIEHTGNQSESPKEVESVASVVESLLAGDTTWTNKEGATRTLTLNDILVIAPYNAQVLALTRRLPHKTHVGTVDKFQGQQAPVVIYSMTTSTPQDAPRGMEFLYSLNRLNVATSRAQCVTVIVASPALFEVQCDTPRQMQLANAFCRYLEMCKTNAESG